MQYGRDADNRPGLLFVRPIVESDVDPITDIFTAMRVERLVYGRIELTAPLGLRFDKCDYACLGTVARGNAWSSVEGQAQPIALAGGEASRRGRHFSHRRWETRRTLGCNARRSPC